MAVVDAYVTQNATSEAADQGPAVLFSGGVKKAMAFSFEVAAADDNNSVYRIARMSPMAIVTSIKLINDATAGITDTDFGFYKPLDVGGAVVDKDCLIDGLDLSAGLSSLTEKYVPTIANVGKRNYELAGVTDYNEYGSFDLCMTSVAAASAAGTISGIIEWIEAV